MSFRGVRQPRAILPLWSAAQLAALLLTSPLLPYLSNDAAWDPAELDDDEAALLSEVRVRCRATALDLLSGQTSATALVGTPSDWLGTAHDDGPSVTTSTDVASALVDIRVFVDKSDHAELFTVVEHRIAEGALEPALSMAIAIVARIAAQGDRSAANVEAALRHHWVDIATASPGRVAVDIASAEFLVSGHIASA